MVFAQAKKQELIQQFREHDTDTGSPEVQVALLTERITYLTSHFKALEHHYSWAGDQWADIKGYESYAAEAHAIDWEGDLYGRRVEISFRRRLREERGPWASARQLRLPRSVTARRTSGCSSCCRRSRIHC